jgi:hypothetical protein
MQNDQCLGPAARGPDPADVAVIGPITNLVAVADRFDHGMETHDAGHDTALVLCGHG